MSKSIYLFSLISFIFCSFSMWNWRCEASDTQSFCNAGNPKIVNQTTNSKGEIVEEAITDAKSWIILFNEFYDSELFLNISKFSLEDSFLAIRDVSKGDSRSPSVQFITGQSSKVFRFQIPVSKSFYMEFCPEKKLGFAAKPGAFTATYYRIEKDEPPLPDFKPERESYEVQFQGLSPREYLKPAFVKEFKSKVKEIAKDFCMIKNITFDETDADSMVSIYSVHGCPQEWFDTLKCASIRHSVCVFFIGPGRRRDLLNYELSMEHLKEMWSGDNINEYLKDLGISLYKFPDKGTGVLLWLFTIFIPVISLILIFLIIWKLYLFFKDDSLHHVIQNSETDFVETNEKKILKPSKYQRIPSFLLKKKSQKSEKKVEDFFNLQQGNYNAGLYQSSFRLRDMPAIARVREEITESKL